MPPKTLRFPLRTVVKNNDVVMTTLAPEENGYGFSLSFFLVIKPRVQNFLPGISKNLLRGYLLRLRSKARPIQAPLATVFRRPLHSIFASKKEFANSSILK